ncbi:MAG: response regulator transcription factor [Byssovorax sp.]
MQPSRPVSLLVVEDDASVASGLVRGLREAGFEVELACDGAQAREALVHRAPDLVVLDLMLPVLSGIELLESVKERPHPPVIVLTARADLGERLRCFALGVVDFVPKPFFLEELVARIRARLRLAEEAPSRVVRWADVELDLDRRLVRAGGAEIALTRHELDILAYLVQRPGRAVTREQIAERALSGIEAPEPRTIDTHVARVRKKLGPAGAAAIATVWGIGYRFTPAGERA